MQSLSQIARSILALLLGGKHQWSFLDSVISMYFPIFCAFIFHRNTTERRSQSKRSSVLGHGFAVCSHVLPLVPFCILILQPFHPLLLKPYWKPSTDFLIPITIPNLPYLLVFCSKKGRKNSTSRYDGAVDGRPMLPMKSWMSIQVISNGIQEL